ncbi:MAG: hypothetical protein QGG40_05500 [Myxococcota bacterium]|nr:hypothetical protein [Myxococcota bacterium]
MTPLLTVALLTGCGSGILPIYPGEMMLEIQTPTYGDFLGDENVQVRGTVYPPVAELSINGSSVFADEYGDFEVDLDVEEAYLVVDVQAAYGEQALRERVPVFAGNDPQETWPGGVTARLLPAGLERMGEDLGSLVDDIGWADMLSESMPAIDEDWLALTPLGIEHDPTIVVLDPVDGGIEAGISLQEVTLLYQLDLDLYGYTTSSEMTFGFSEILLTILTVPSVDDDGMVGFALTDSTIDFDDPQIEIGSLSGFILEWLIEELGNWILEPLGETLLDSVMDQFGAIELGGPFAMEMDLMGLTVEARLSELYGDPDGLAIGLGLGLGESVPDGALGIPVPTEADAPSAHAAMGLHEGLVDLMASDTVLGMMSQSIDLSGSFGEILGSGIRALPGGDDAPDGDGWCLSMEPGEAHVARLQEGIEPLAVIYLPDLQVDVGIMDGSHCETWLLASLALEVGLEVTDGTQLGLDLEIGDGAVLSYGSTDDWTEAEVIDGLGSYLEVMIGLLGSSFELDLADLLGGFGDSGGLGDVMGDLAIALVDSTAMTDENDLVVEGLYAVSIDLWEQD